MPRITGNRVAGAYGPRLLLDWSILEQDVSGNRTKVKVSVSMDVNGPIDSSTKGNVRIAIGSSVANRTPSTSSGRTARSRYLAEHTAWVPHNSDGTKTVSIKADWTGVGLNWLNTYVNSVSAGGNASLTKIARTTTIKSASVKYTLQTDDNNSPIANQINLSLNIGNSSFRHRIWLEYNGVFVGEWLDQTNPTSLELNTTHVGRMLGHLSNSTSGTFKLYVGTDSGGTRIGYSTVNIEASVNSEVMPKFTSNTVAISGKGTDKTWGEYIQNISRAQVSLRGEAGHGATVSKTSIKIGGSLIVSGTSGSISGTSSIISSSGTVSLEYSITDSRGRTTKDTTKSIKVQPYLNPAIKEFSVVRGSDPTKATLKYTIEHSTVGGKNSLTVNPRQNGTIVKGATYKGTDARVSNSQSIDITGLNKFATYDFTLASQDNLGNRAESAITLTSSSLPLSLDKNNKGIGVGKDYTKGALDVGGDAYISGKLYLNNIDIAQGNHTNNKKFTVGGDANNYYPVTIAGQGKFAWNRYTISRAYNAPAPNTWNTSTHKGGLTFAFEWTGDTYWGGNKGDTYRVIAFEENYSTMVGGMSYSLSGIVVWLRGGGAQYTLHSERGSQADVKVHLSGFTESAPKRSYPVRNNNSQVQSEVYARYPVRGNGKYLYQDGDRVVNSGSTPNGEWVRFADGTQIAWKEILRIEKFEGPRVLSQVWELPVTFAGTRPTCFVEKDAYSSANSVNKATTGSLVNPDSDKYYRKANIYVYFGDDAPAQSHYGVGVRVMVIGRWK